MFMFYVLSFLLVSHFCTQYLTSIPIAHNHRSFLKGSYRVTSSSTDNSNNNEKQQQLFFRVRQVPGDGGCLFHAISAWISYLYTDSHLEFDWRLRNLSKKLRQLAVDTLQQNQTLLLENGEYINSYSLLEMVSEHYNMSSTEYCEQMYNPRTWGGGPEIVALSNHFQCPIHVYQLTATGKGNLFSKPTFCFELCAKFGSPCFDNKSTIYLLCADGRFPYIKPGKHKQVGDHFLAIFPEADIEGDSSVLLQTQCPSPSSANANPNHNSQRSQLEQQDMRSISRDATASPPSRQHSCFVDISNCPVVKKGLLNIPDLLLSQLQQPPHQSSHHQQQKQAKEQEEEDTKLSIEQTKPDSSYHNNIKSIEGLDKHIKLDNGRSHSHYRKTRKSQLLRWLSRHED